MIFFRFGADASDLKREAKDGKTALAELRKEVRDGINTAGKWAAAMAAAGAAIGIHLVKNSLEAIEVTRQLAEVANATNQEFTRQAHAAKTVGIETEKLADIYKDVNDRVGDFLSTGGGPMLDFFENIAPKVGVTAEQFKKLSGPQAMQLYVDSLEKANVSQQEMTFYLEAMASDSTKLLPLLRNGGEEMARLGDEADRFGKTLSDIDAEQIRQAQRSLENVGAVFEGLLNRITVQLAPVLEALANQFIGVSTSASTIGEKADQSFSFIVDSAAFVINAIEGIKRVFEGVANVAVASGAGVKDALLLPIREYTNIAKNAPGAIGRFFTDVNEKVKSEMRLAEGVVTESVNRINELLMEPLPGEGFKRFAAEKAAESRAAAQAVIDARREMEEATTNQGGGFGSSMNQEDLEALQGRIDALRNTYATEKELLMQKFAEQQEILDEANDQRLLKEGEYLARSFEINDEYQRQLAEMEKEQADKRKAIAEAEKQAKLNFAKNMFSGLSALMNSESRKLFEIGKAAAISNASIAAYESMSDAFKFGTKIGGPYVGAAFAALAGLAQFPRIEAIRSQSFGGGGAGAQATGSNTAAVNAASEPVGGGGGQPSQTLFVSGLSPDDLFSGEQVRELAGRLVDFQKDGGQVVFAE